MNVSVSVTSICSECFMAEAVALSVLTCAQEMGIAVPHRKLPGEEQRWTISEEWHQYMLQGLCDEFSFSKVRIRKPDDKEVIL